MSEAFTAPGNFAASKTTAKPGDSITFTWEPATVLNDNAGIDFYQVTGFNQATGQYVKNMPGNTEIPATSRSYTCTFPSDASTYILYFVSAIGHDETTPDAIGPASNQIKIYVDSGGGEDPDPPAVDAGARLEQFQNSDGADIYPKTVVEGVFRQSDGKTLEQILSETSAMITCGTADLTAGVSPLASGTLYGVYEV